MGIDLQIAADSTTVIVYRGNLLLADLPSLIESQTSCSVTVRGSLWIVEDTGSPSVPARTSAYATSGGVVSNTDNNQRGYQRAELQRIAGSRRYRVYLWFADDAASAGIDATITPSASLSGNRTRFEILGLDGGTIDFASTTSQRFQISNYTDQGNRIAGAYETLTAGLKVKGRCRQVGPALWHIVGSIELSNFADGNGGTNVRSITLDSLLDSGKAVKMLQLDTAGLSLALQKQWSIRGNAGILALWLVLVPEDAKSNYKVSGIIPGLQKIADKLGIPSKLE